MAASNRFRPLRHRCGDHATNPNEENMTREQLIEALREDLRKAEASKDKNSIKTLRRRLQSLEMFERKRAFMAGKSAA
jgi:hypothetical protein